MTTRSARPDELLSQVDWIRGLARRLDAAHGGDRRSWCVALAPLARGRDGAVAGLGATGALMGWELALVGAAAVTEVGWRPE